MIYNACWLRRDLRLHDHVALSAATSNTSSSVVFFVFDEAILSSIKNKKSHHVQFMFDALLEIDKKLRERKNRLVILQGDPVEVIPKFCKRNNIKNLFFNRDYEPYALKRDDLVTKNLAKIDTFVFSYKDHVLFEPSEVTKADGQPYKVFTPYMNTWLKGLPTQDLSAHPVNLKSIFTPTGERHLDASDLKKIGFEQIDLGEFASGTTGGNRALDAFHINDYKNLRDLPGTEGTSRISPHIRFGTISIRELFAHAKKSRTAGAATWIKELIWREFYQAILFHFPHVAEKSFLPRYEKMKWPGKKEHLRLWQQGQTGFPIIDAGMRQLKNTGWMHNRVRMIVASFLTKDLLISWQEGEDWFRENLIDYELASNNGGWQWAASTGCDPQPYFRIFNPLLQSEKFDPEGEYIKKYVPELQDVPVKFIHDPSEMPIDIQRKSNCIIGKDYPPPIVNHSAQKLKALKLFEK